MKRKTASLLSIVMVLAMLLSFSAVATAETKSGSFSLVVGNTDIDTNNYTAALTPRSSNENVAKVEVVRTGGYDKVQITGVAVGTATITYEALLTGESVYHNYVITVTVTSSAVASNGLPGQTIGVGASYTTAAYTNISEVTSSNASVATAVAENGIVRVTGVAAGSAEISFYHLEGASRVKKTLPITVSTNNSTSDTIDLAIGGVFTMQHYEISSTLSGNPAIAKVETKSPTAGNVQAIITGMANGTTTVTVNYKENASSANTSRTITVRVGTDMGGNSTPAAAATGGDPTFQTVAQPKVASSKIPENSSTAGIYIPKRTVNAKQGKTYRVPNIKLEGKSVKASTLRWVAENANVLEVNAKTGTFKCLTAGESKLFATDMNGKYMNYVTVTVK